MPVLNLLTILYLHYFSFRGQKMVNNTSCSQITARFGWVQCSPRTFIFR